MLKIAHTNFNVLDLSRSLTFYKEALGLKEVRRKEQPGKFLLVFLSDGITEHQVELTYLYDRTEPYDLSDNEIHLAFYTDEFEKDLSRHQQMGIVCQYEQGKNLYFIEDPDGYWIEIIKAKGTV